MRSDSLDAASHEGGADQGVVRRLLDPAFGLFVWAGHLVVVYVAQAVACVLDVPSRSARAESTMVMALAMVTILAAAGVALHGVWRYRQGAETPNGQFLHRVTVSQDAIAALAILWQLIPIFMLPLCR